MSVNYAAVSSESYEFVAQLEEAQELLRQAHALIAEYCDATGDTRTLHYLANPLRIMIDEDHNFMSRDVNLGRVIDGLLHPEEE